LDEIIISVESEIPWLVLEIRASKLNLGENDAIEGYYYSRGCAVIQGNANLQHLAVASKFNWQKRKGLEESFSPNPLEFPGYDYHEPLRFP
jgi:hypothetical protein